MKSRWKLHLRPKHLASSIDRENDLPPLPLGKSADDLLTDFIKYLFGCVKTYIHKHHLAFPWSSVEDSIEYIFTHPNGWEGVQQQRYRRAIAHAGLVPGTREGQSRVHMLTEGEASLHFCVANLVNTETTNQADPQGVVIIDAGGGTIDLSVFSMMSNPISCEEIAPAECMELSLTTEFFLIHLYPFSGRLQGSVFVTRRAKALLESWWLSFYCFASDEPENSKRRKTRRLGALQRRRDSRIYTRLRPDNETRHQKRSRIGLRQGWWSSHQ